MEGESYASPADYAALFPGEEPGEDALRTASAHIDGATFCRIRGLGGLSALTERQRRLLTEAVCRQAKFEAENAALMSWAAGSYAINGVSMKLSAGAGVRYYGGIPLPGEVTTLLDQTGLTVRLGR